jgi:hypothetical protein
MPPITSERHSITLPEGWTPPKFVLGQEVKARYSYREEVEMEFGIITGFNHFSPSHPSCSHRLPGWEYTITLHSHSSGYVVYGGSAIFLEQEILPND